MTHRAIAVFPVLFVALAGGGCKGSPVAIPEAPKTPDLSSSAVALAGRTYAFDTDPEGRLPRGFSFVPVLSAPSGRWQITAVPVAVSLPNALGWSPPTQTGGGEGETKTKPVARGAAILIEEAPPRAFRVSVQVRPQVRGEGLAGGIVIAYQDPRNFVFATVSWDDGLFCVDRAAQGETRRLARGVCALPETGWALLELDVDGAALSGRVNGAPILSVRDRSLVAPGSRIGLWAEGAAGTLLFDDLSIHPR